MNGPRVVTDLGLLYGRRPFKANTAHALTHDHVVDCRRALGSVPHKPGMPNHGCESCWPAQVHAPYWDASGKACCPACINNPNRIARMPHFTSGSLH